MRGRACELVSRVPHHPATDNHPTPNTGSHQPCHDLTPPSWPVRWPGAPPPTWRRARAGSIHLDCAEDLPHEDIARVEADRAREQEENHGGDGHVAKVEQRRDKLGDLELRKKVEDRVRKLPPPRACASEPHASGVARQACASGL
eukprot:879947-Prymnesium_polylepis.1